MTPTDRHSTSLAARGAVCLLALLAAAPAISAQADATARIQQIQTDYRTALDFIRRADESLGQLPSGDACAHLTSASNLLRGVSIDARREWRNISVAPEARSVMLEIANDADATRRQVESVHYERCAPQRTPQQEEAELRAAADRSLWLANAFEELEMHEALWRAMNRGSGVQDPVAVRQFIAAVSRTGDFYDKAVALERRLSAKQPRSALPRARAALPAGVVLASFDSDGQKFRDCSFCPEMVVQADEQRMVGFQNGKIPVVLKHSVAIGVSEVTRAQWRACVADGACASAPLGDDAERVAADDHPIGNVLYDEALAYAAWLSTVTGKSYVIPSELEWEYAAAGIAMKKSGEVNGWNYSKSIGRDLYLGSSPAGAFGAEKNGTVDMIGNIAEWVQGCYRDDYKDAATDGSIRGLVSMCATAPVKGGGFGVKSMLSPGGAEEMPKGVRDPSVGLRVMRRDPKRAVKLARLTVPPMFPNAEPFSLGVPAGHKIVSVPPPREPGAVPLLQIEGGRLNCRVFVASTWFSGRTDDPFFRVSSAQTLAMTGNRFDLARESDSGRVIDGARTWSGRTTINGTPKVMHLRLSKGKPALLSYCDAGGDPAETHAMISSVRWAGEPDRGITLDDERLPPLPDHLEEPIDAPGERRTFGTTALTTRWPLPKQPEPAEQFEQIGFSVRLPSDDWALFPESYVHTLKNMSDLFGSFCRVSGSGRLVTQSQLDSIVSSRADSSNLRAIDGGLTVIEERTAEKTRDSVLRLRVGRPPLGMVCYTGRNGPAPLSNVRTIMASLRWADEPATDDIPWWRKPAR